MDIAIQLKKRNLEMIDHRQHVLGGTYISLIPQHYYNLNFLST